MSIIRQILAFTVLAVAATLAVAQAFPVKPITVVVPYAPGGAADITARIVAQRMTESTGKPVVVENRGGAGGAIGWAVVAKAAPDGYTVLLSDSSMAVAAAFGTSLPVDLRNDFVHLSIAISVPFVLVVHPAVPARSVAELIAYGKAHPGKLNFGSGGNGTSVHLTGERFKSLAGIQMEHVPYKGGAAAMQDVLAGQLQLMFMSTSASLSHVKSGKLRALMVAAENRVPSLPDVPSAPEAGVAMMIADAWYGFAVPAKTPPDVIQILHKEIDAALNSSFAKSRFAETSADIIGNTPAQAAKYVTDDIQKWSTTVKASGIKLQ